MKKRIIPFILVLALVLTPTFVAQAIAIENKSEAQTLAKLASPLMAVAGSWSPSIGSEGPLPPIGVEVNGEPVLFDGQLPIIVDSRTLVPVRGVFEHVGFDVDWDPIARQVALTSTAYEVILTIDSAEFTTNGVIHTLDVSAQIINDRTMLPIRAVLESVGYYVYWDSRNRMVVVSSTPITFITLGGEQFRTTLTWLDVEFGLTNEELAQIAELPYLTGLGVTGSQITDIRPLANLTNLTSLRINGAQVTDLTPISNLTNLTYLQISGTQVTNLSPLANLTRLEYLSLNGNQITNISPLASLANLWSLDINQNQIVDLSPLTGLTNLVSLNLNHNQITDISPLAGLMNLKNLALSHNQIINIPTLSSLTNVDTVGFLDLSNNQITDISPLREVSGWSLRLSNNPITDWSPVAHLEWVEGRP